MGDLEKEILKKVILLNVITQKSQINFFLDRYNFIVVRVN